MTESRTHTPPARPRGQRIADTLAMLDREVDCWVATSDPDSGAPQLVPLSFVWDGTTVLLTTRDVVMVDGDIEVIEAADLSTEEGDRFALRTGFDPRSLRARYLYFRVRPTRIQAWREENELAARDLMRDGAWFDA